MSRPMIIATYWFQSSNGSGLHETLVYAGGTTSCACPGWTRRVDASGNRSCKHTRMVEAGIGAENAVKYNVHPDYQTATSPPSYTTTTNPPSYTAPAPAPTKGRGGKVQPIKLPGLPGQRKFFNE